MSIPVFQVNDEVVCIDPIASLGLHRGWKYRVQAFYGDQLVPMVVVRGIDYKLNAHRFELTRPGDADEPIDAQKLAEADDLLRSF